MSASSALAQFEALCLDLGCFMIFIFFNVCIEANSISKSNLIVIPRRSIDDREPLRESPFAVRQKSISSVFDARGKGNLLYVATNRHVDVNVASSEASEVDSTYGELKVIFLSLLDPNKFICINILFYINFLH